MYGSSKSSPEVPEGTIRELRVLLNQDQPLLAIDKLMKETGMTLLDSITYVENLDTALRETVPKSAEKKARLFLHRGQVEEAVHYVNNRTELGEHEATEYIESLRPSIKIHISIEDEQEIVELLRDGNKMKAVHRVRALNTVGLKDVMEYLTLITEGMSMTNAAEATTSSGSRRMEVAMAPQIDKSIKQQYDQADWEGVARLLSFYGEEEHELEQERVQLAILELAEGDVQKLPRLVSSAKEDYRDILWWHES